MDNAKEINYLRQQLTTCESENKTYDEVTKFLFNRLSKEERMDLLNKHNSFKKSFRKVNLCTICLSKSPNTKCIHYDCPGACQKCIQESCKNEGNCCACDKKQIMQCPICFDSHKEQYLKIFNCHHCVCWKCYSNAFEAKKKLTKCPQKHLFL